MKSFSNEELGGRIPNRHEALIDRSLTAVKVRVRVRVIDRYLTAEEGGRSERWVRSDR
jgi:hypothetical protein